MSQDEAIRATNDDAAVCKRCAIQLGYWLDPYLPFFVKSADRKPPEINRGYYARVSAIQILLQQFIDASNRECQVVNLGAGYDTRFWTLTDSHQTPKLWVEIDFEAVTTNKVHYIKARKQLAEKLTEPTYTRSTLHSSGFHIVGCDMRSIDDLMASLDACGMNRKLPTAFISECVLVYMPGDSSKSILKTIADNFPIAFFVNYEQVNMADKFGRLMVENLQARGCGLAGVDHCMTLATQKDRFLSTGWQGSDALHMMDVYKSLPQADIQRIEKIEMLDDYENMAQLFEHYCVAWAYINRDKTSTLRLEKISLKKL